MSFDRELSTACAEAAGYRRGQRVVASRGTSARALAPTMPASPRHGIGYANNANAAFLSQPHVCGTGFDSTSHFHERSAMNEIDRFPALRAWRDAGEFITVRDHRIYCRRAGTGPRLLLIHGFPTSSFDWAPMWPMLTARFEVLAFDLLGLGFSAKPRGHRYRVHEQADLAEAVAHHYGWRTACVLAHDYGDTVAQELLAPRCASFACAFSTADCSRKRIAHDSSNVCSFRRSGLPWSG
jgi:hypothetical protein